MIPRIAYGRTGLTVSRLCFGTGQLMAGRFGVSTEEGAELMRHAWSLGVSFFDTAIGYDTHRHVGLALRSLPRPEVVVNTKTGAATAAEARASVEQSLHELGVDYIDIMMLHGIRSDEDFRRREAALDELVKAKNEGLLRAVGASTHVFTGGAMRACIGDPRIEVILTLVNRTGVGLRGDYREHLALVAEAYRTGKAVAGMKILGEGYMADSAEDELRHAFTFPDIHAVDLGMASRAQVEMAALIAGGEDVPSALRAAARLGAKGEWGERFPDAYH